MRNISCIIINADDFGKNEGVNSAIIHCFENGLCSSATIMPNMPGFEEASELLHAYDLTDHVGLHLTLTEGRSVTERIRSFARFCDNDGRFRLSRKERVIRLDLSEKEALKEEIDGQIIKCRKYGIPITHLDSHSHVHEEWGVTSLVIEAAHKANIPHVRLCKNFGLGTSPMKQLYRCISNIRLRKAGLAATRYFGDPDDYKLFCQRYGTMKGARASWEVMIHPIFNTDQRLMDGWLSRPLENVIQTLQGYETAVSYTYHRYRHRAG